MRIVSWAKKSHETVLWQRKFQALKPEALYSKLGNWSDSAISSLWHHPLKWKIANSLLVFDTENPSLNRPCDQLQIRAQTFKILIYSALRTVSEFTATESAKHIYIYCLYFKTIEDIITFNKRGVYILAQKPYYTPPKKNDVFPIPVILFVHPFWLFSNFAFILLF